MVERKSKVGDAYMSPRRNERCGDVGDSVAKVVDVDDLAGGAGGGVEVEKNGGLERFGQIEQGSAGGEHSGDGGKDVPAVESVARNGGLPDDFEGFAGALTTPSPGDQAVIRTYDELVVNSDHDGESGGADGGIDDGQVDGCGRKGIDRPLQCYRTLDDVARRDGVSDVDQARRGDVAEQNCFHGRDVPVVKAEVCCERDNRQVSDRRVGHKTEDMSVAGAGQTIGMV